MKVTSKVYRKGELRYNMTGQSFGQNLHETQGEISPFRVKKLVKYAIERLEQAGFEFAKNWNIEVFTNDHEDRVDDQMYCVDFKNEKRGYITLVGILVKNANPTLNHGFEIGQY